MGSQPRLSLVNPRLEGIFLGLALARYSVTSPQDPLYNCIAWAAGEDNVRWWPDPCGIDFWPDGAARTETLQAFEEAYGLLGYRRCLDAEPEWGFEKVAIYTNANGEPTHAARQLPDGTWTSKLGDLEDIQHEGLDCLNGIVYGTPALFMRRPNRAFLSLRRGCLIAPLGLVGSWFKVGDSSPLRGVESVRVLSVNLQPSGPSRASGPLRQVGASLGGT